MMFLPNSAENSLLNTDDQEKTRNVLVIIVMAITHKINIKNSPEINLGQDFADAWVKEIFFEARGVLMSGELPLDCSWKNVWYSN